MQHTLTGTDEALAAVEKAAEGVRGTLYTLSVLDEAAEMLVELWAVGESRGVGRRHWGEAAVDLAGGALDVIGARYRGPVQPERTEGEVSARLVELVDSLTCEEIGLGACVGPGGRVVVDRLPQTPCAGDLAVGLCRNGGWEVRVEGGGPSVTVVAPVSAAGAAEVAAMVHAIVHGQLNPF